MKPSFPYGKTLLVGFGFLGISIIWPMFDQFLPIFLQAGNPEFERQLLAEGREIPNVVGFGLAPSLALFVMTWDNLINIFFQPWVGARSDRTWNRFGRRKGWILLGLPIAMLGFVLLPVAQSVIALMVFILLTNFGMALFRSPTIAWLGDLFKPEDRSKANGIINLMGGVGGLLAYLGGGYLFNNMGRSAPFIAGAIATILAMIVVLIYVKEPREVAASTDDHKDTTRNVLKNLSTVFTNPDRSGMYVLLSILLWFIGYNALSTSLSSFAVFTLGMKPGTASIYSASMTISFIIMALPAGLLAGRLGRKRTIQIGLVGLTVLALTGYFIIQDPITFVIVLVVAGAFWALINVNSLPLVYDHGDETKIGAYTGLYYFSSQTAAVVGPTLAGILVDTMGDQYRWVWLFSTLFMALAFSTMFGVRDNK